MLACQKEYGAHRAEHCPLASPPQTPAAPATPPAERRVQARCEKCARFVKANEESCVTCGRKLCARCKALPWENHATKQQQRAVMANMIRRWSTAESNGDPPVGRTRT